MAEERRTFLRNGWNWIRLAATAALCYPLFRFVKFKVPKKPRLVKVEKLLKVGDVYLDQEYANGPQEFIVVNRQEFMVGNYEARRTLLEANLSNIYVGVAQYAIFDGTNVWVINCGSHFNEFYTWLPEFDKIARTFRLIGQ